MSSQKREFKIKLMSKIRRGVQIIFLFFFIYLLFQARFPYQGKIPSELFLRFDPLAQLLASLSSREFTSWFWMGLITLGLTIIFGRVFCGWLCPMGTTIEFTEKLLPKRKPLPKPASFSLKWFKYFLLFLVIFSALAGRNFWYLLDPIPLVHRIYILVFYPLLVYLGKSGLELGEPLLEKLGLERLAYLQLTPAYFNQVFLTAGIFAGIILLSLWMPRFFCQNLCPLGALLGIFSRFSLLGKNVSSSCIDCGLCLRSCPVWAIEEKSWQDKEAECIKCFICQDRCPTSAIAYGFFKKGFQRSYGVNLSRRSFLGASLLGLGAGFLARGSSSAQSKLNEIIRPPGAIPEQEFLARCTRCGKCIKICPTRVIQAQGLEQGLEGFSAPRMIMRIAGCDQECTLCGEICPTDALRALELEEKKYAKLGSAEINQQRCLVWAWGQVCLICDEICPYNAIVFQEIDGLRRPVVIPSRCNGCGWCEYACPVKGESAIRVSKSGEIRLAQGSYKETAQKQGIELSAQDQLE